MTTKDRAFSATIWNASEILVRQGFQFLISLVLVRLLSPEEFGTIALLLIFSGVAAVIADGGLSSALIQRKETSITDESTVFWINAAVGLLLGLGICLSGTKIAQWFQLPVLSKLALIMGLNVFISSLGTVHLALLTKRLEFKLLLKVGGIAAITSGAIAIWMATQDYGVWALATQLLVATTITTAGLWIVSPWRPRLIISLESGRSLWRFGSFIMLAGLLDVAYTRLYTVLIGRFYGVGPLGLYWRADSAKQLPVGVLSAVLSRVALPIFSSVADDLGKLRRGARLAVQGMMTVNAPVMIGLAVVADPLFELLFGRQWLEAVPIFQVLCLAGVLWPLHVININALNAQGHAGLFFKLEIAKKVCGFLLTLAGFQFGILGIAWSQVVFGIFAFFVNSYYSRVFIRYGAYDQIKDFGPSTFIAAVMGIAVFGFRSFTAALPSWAELFVLAGLGATIYISLSFAVGTAGSRALWGALRDNVKFRGSN